MAVEVHRGRNLLDDAVVHNRDTVAECESLGLVMGDVKHGGGEAGVKAGNLRPHEEAGRSVEIGQGLVEQEDLWAPDKGAAEGDPLALAARKIGRFTVQASSEFESLRSVLHAPGNLRPRNMPKLQPEDQIVINRHMGVEGIILEDHGDITVLGRKVVDNLAVDGDGTGGGRFEAGDEAQGRGFATT